eukprot:7605760-Lingulodinium_polyedra.AAC.1
MKHRLGARFLAEACKRYCCGGTFDVKARHAGCCASAESTRGRYAVTRQLYALRCFSNIRS